MRHVELGRLVLCFVIALLCAGGVAEAQRSKAKKSKVSPLSGHDFIGGYVGGNLTLAPVAPGLIPVPDDSFTLSDPGGAGYEFALSYSRLMPALFVATSTTAELRFLYTHLIQTSSGSGTAYGPDSYGNWSSIDVCQATTITTTIAAAQLRFSFDTHPMAKTTPTVLLAGTFGHITDIEYETDYTPEGLVQNNAEGIPQGGILPARRWFYAAVHLGVGGRFSLGDPADSPAIVPELEFLIPLTSLARYENWLPIGIRGSLGLRWPL